MNLPKRMSLANLPTPLVKLEKLSKTLGGPQIWIKRDDYTGLELSGNKVRKLEFALAEALEQGCDYLITCGGTQSNHARATAAAAAKLGLGVSLLLVGHGGLKPKGNLLMDLMFGAEIRYVSGDDYTNHRTEMMAEMAEELKAQGHKPYILPEGASNGIGAFGYCAAMEEIQNQLDAMSLDIDLIVSASGSGGTLAGQLLGDYAMGMNRKKLGFAVGKDKGYFEKEIRKIVESGLEIAGRLESNMASTNLDQILASMEINDQYIGKGYGVSSEALIRFIHGFAKLEGIVLDPVYTGKAMYGLTQEIKKGHLKAHKNILFIHTGGLFGIMGRTEEFYRELQKR